MDRPAERPHSQGARRVSRPQGARGSVLAALRDRLARRSGASPQGEISALFLHAPRRQAEPGGALRARRARRRRPRARGRERAGRRRHARARLVVAVGGRRAGGLRRLRRRQRGVGAARARRRHRSRPARRDPADASLLARLVRRRQGVLLHALSERGQRAGRRGEVPPQRLSPSPGRRSGARREDLRRRARPQGLAHRRDVAQRTLARGAGQPGLVEERGLLARRACGRQGAAPAGHDRRRNRRHLRRRRDARGSHLHPQQPGGAARPPVCGRPAPSAARALEGDPAPERGDPRERDRAARPDRRALSQGRDIARAALLGRRQAAARAGVARPRAARPRSAASGTATSCSCRSRRSSRPR